MTENKRRFKTIIAGKTYTIVGNKAPEHLAAVSELVNAQLEQIKEAAPALGREERGILVAVNAISDQLTKQLEIEALMQKVAMLEQTLLESQSVAQAPEVEEAAQAEPEQTSAEGAPEAKTVEAPEKDQNAKKTTEVAAEKEAAAHFAGIQRDNESQPFSAMPATISELQQAARTANELPARKSNSKFTKTTTASEAALKRAQHRNQVRSALGVNKNAENAIPSYTKNQENDGKK